jgi:hypothetical protein
MFDWNVELETTKRTVAELEALVSRSREVLRQQAGEGTPIDKIVDMAKRTLSVRVASLKRARFHQRFIEHKIQTGARAVESLPYKDLARICFSAADWMPAGKAADSVGAQAAAFYTKSVTDKKISPTEADAKVVFQSMAAQWRSAEKRE